MKKLLTEFRYVIIIFHSSSNKTDANLSYLCLTTGLLCFHGNGRQQTSIITLFVMQK